MLMRMFASEDKERILGGRGAAAVVLRTPGSTKCMALGLWLGAAAAAGMAAVGVDTADALGRVAFSDTSRFKRRTLRRINEYLVEMEMEMEVHGT